MNGCAAKTVWKLQTGLNSCICSMSTPRCGSTPDTALNIWDRLETKSTLSRSLYSSEAQKTKNRDTKKWDSRSWSLQHWNNTQGNGIQSNLGGRDHIERVIEQASHWSWDPKKWRSKPCKYVRKAHSGQREHISASGTTGQKGVARGKEDTLRGKSNPCRASVHACRAPQQNRERV